MQSSHHAAKGDVGDGAHGIRVHACNGRAGAHSCGICYSRVVTVFAACSMPSSHLQHAAEGDVGDGAHGVATEVGDGHVAVARVGQPLRQPRSHLQEALRAAAVAMAIVTAMWQR
jgi:hypothetical protein